MNLMPGQVLNYVLLITLEKIYSTQKGSKVQCLSIWFITIISTTISY